MVFLERVEARDVRVIEACKQAGFPSQPPQPMLISDQFFGKYLDCDVATDARVSRAIHLSHPAFAKSSEDFVPAEPRAYLHETFRPFISEREREALRDKKFGMGACSAAASGSTWHTILSPLLLGQERAHAEPRQAGGIASIRPGLRSPVP